MSDENAPKRVVDGVKNPGILAYYTDALGPEDDVGIGLIEALQKTLKTPGSGGATGHLRQGVKLALVVHIAARLWIEWCSDRGS